jgi:hypothetical protein
MNMRKSVKFREKAHTGFNSSSLHHRELETKEHTHTEHRNPTKKVRLMYNYEKITVVHSEQNPFISSQYMASLNSRSEIR